MEDAPVDVGQSSFQAVVVVGQSLVVEPHKMKDRRVEIKHGGLIHDGLESEFIALSIAERLLDPGSGEEAGERVGVVIPPRTIALKKGHASEFSAPYDQGVLHKASSFQVLNQRGGWLIHDFGLHRVSLQDVGVRIPIGDAVAAGGVASVKELDDPDSLLDEAAGENAILRISPFEFGARIGSVSPVDGAWFVRKIHHLRHGQLHSACEFVAGDPGGEILVVRKSLKVASVETGQEIDRGLIVCR